MDLPMGVKLAAFSREKLFDLWEKLKPFESLFTDEDMKNPEVFLENFLARDSITLELEGGLVLIKHIVPGHKAEFHATFWDKHLSSRQVCLRECLFWAFVTFRLERLETYVADYARAVRRFLQERLGFRHEGCMRAAALAKGRLIDIHIYSLLREEVKL
jgi:RimJ/RimL family protein N-acetyltransferase